MEVRSRFAHLIGRDEDLARIVDLLATRRVVTLTGPGGVGKTRLADHLVTQLDDRDPSEDVAYVALDSVTEPGLVGHTIAAALGIRAGGDVGSADYLAEHVGTRRFTVVLDNCERIVDSVADLVAVLVEACPNVRFLATSQIPLGIAAETVYPVAPLPVPTREGPEASLDTLAPALAFFADRARSASPSFELTEENIAVAVEVVRALEGLPLAIELAAARLRVLSLEGLRDRLLERFDVLGVGYRDAPERHRSLTASIAWIDELCTPEERSLWAGLSVFVGGFDLVDVETVCAGLDIAAGDVLDVLGGLVDKSVVLRLDDGQDRFRMLETLRQFGSDRLEESGALVTWRDRHRDRFAEVVRDLCERWVGPEQPSILQRYERESANIRAALDHALAAEDTVPLALQMCFHLKPYWITEGLSGEARYWMDRALRFAVGSPRDRALVYAANTSVAFRLGDLPHARLMIDAARDQAAALTDPFVEGAIALAEGQVLLRELDLDAACAQFRRSVDLLGDYPDRFEYPSALVLVGLIFSQLGYAEDGRELLQRVTTLGDATGESTARAYAQVWLAFHAILIGEVEEADRMLRSSVELVWVLRDQVGIALQLEAAAYGAHWKGLMERCALMLGAADAQWRRMDLQVDNLLPGLSAERFNYRREVPVDHPVDFGRGQTMPPEEAVQMAFDGVDAKLPTGPVAAAHAARGAPALGPLSRRESEVAMLVADGLSNREIATRLFISERTAQGHVQSALRKLDFGSRSQIAAWTVRQTG